MWHRSRKAFTEEAFAAGHAGSRGSNQPRNLPALHPRSISANPRQGVVVHLPVSWLLAAGNIRQPLRPHPSIIICTLSRRLATSRPAPRTRGHAGPRPKGAGALPIPCCARRSRFARSGPRSWADGSPTSRSRRIRSPSAADGSGRSSTSPPPRAAIFKSTNAGVSWTPVFDSVRTGSIGAVAVAPSNSDIVWVGTGEANNMRSSSWGTGVYKSTDGGQDVVGRDAAEVAAHRAHRRRSARPERRVRGGDGPALVERRRARPVQDDGWRQDLDEHEADQREHGIHRAGDGSLEPGRPLRGVARARAARVRIPSRGSRERHLEDARRGPDVDAARRRAALGRARPHRARRVPLEAIHALRRRSREGTGQRHLSVRRHGLDLAPGQRRERHRVVLQPGALRSGRSRARHQPERHVARVVRRRQGRGRRSRRGTACTAIITRSGSIPRRRSR